MNPTYDDVERALLSRWPESRLEPSLDRIGALCRLLGDPQTSYPVIQLTGTNGKTTTSRMIDELIRALGLRTGRFTSPHLESMTERISLDGQPLSQELFVDAFADVAAYAQVVDDTATHPLSYFETLVAMAYAAFADSPVDAAIIEVGMGGAWDATNVANAQVAVLTPIAVDHASYLGDRPEDIAVEKAGIIKPGTHAVIAQQSEAVMDVLMHRANEVGASVSREGVDFQLLSRVTAVGGQMISLQGLSARYDEVFLPLHGAHQAHNAAYALAAVEAFIGRTEIDGDLVREAFSNVTAPGRLELVRHSPSVVLDAAHNPHGAAAAMEAMQEAFSFSPLIGVVSIMADKDTEEMLRIFEPVMAQIVCTQNSSDRSLPATELAEMAGDIFGADRVHTAARLDDALEKAMELAEVTEGHEEAIGGGGVLVTGSVVTVGEARVLLGGAS